jgi:hypothetical protein
MTSFSRSWGPLISALISSCPFWLSTEQMDFGFSPSMKFLRTTGEIDELLKSLLKRHPGEPRIRSGAGAGVQNFLKKLDSGFRRHDEFYGISTFFEIIEIDYPLFHIPSFVN